MRMFATMAGAVVFCLAAFTPAAQAGIYADDLGKCLVAKSSEADKLVLVQWVFSAIALHPDVAQYAKISKEQGAQMSKSAGMLMQRLMTVDCRKEMVSAIKYEGGLAIESGFQVLGEVAMRGLFGNPQVMASMSGLEAGTDKGEMKKLYDEAGVAIPAQ